MCNGRSSLTDGTVTETILTSPCEIQKKFKEKI